MSDLNGRINEATKAAMKDRDKSRVAVMRLINSEIKRVTVDERRDPTDSDVLAVLSRMVKQRNDSESQFRAAGRIDLADKEAYEIGVIREFMPEPLSAGQLDELVRRAIETTGAASLRDMGKVMSVVRDAVQGRADLGIVSARVKALLST
jgi:uncharacterized protein